MEIRSDPDTSYFRGSDSDPVVLEGDIRFFFAKVGYGCGYFIEGSSGFS